MNGKTILLYGENGSGKSSIIWGLYTLMESHKKAVADVQKCFDPDNDQHLRNHYSARNDHSSVKITFVPVANGIPPKEYEISDTIISTQTAEDDFIRLTTAAFDMFNYRMLSDWIYQKNSRSIDLFGRFEKDIFKYLYLRRAYAGTPYLPKNATYLCLNWCMYGAFNLYRVLLLSQSTFFILVKASLKLIYADVLYVSSENGKDGKI